MQFTASALADSELHLFYRLDNFPFVDGPEITLGSFAEQSNERKANCIPVDQVNPLSRRYASTAVWREVGPASQDGTLPKIDISSDLHPELVQLLGGERPELLKRWKLTPIAERFLQSADLYEREIARDNRRAKAIWLTFGARSKARLSSSGSSLERLRLVLGHLDIIMFATGVAFLVVQISPEKETGDLTASELVETVHAISRFNKCYWGIVDGEGGKASAEFTLGTLLRSLSQPTLSPTVEADRVTTYVYGQLREHLAPAELDRFAAYCARRYTEDYEVDMQQVDLEWVRDFTNVRHAIAEEGVATIHSPPENGPLPDFLAIWKTDKLRSAYAPIVLLLLHENWFLSRKRNAVFALDGEADDIEVLEDVVGDAMMFRLDFRFSSVSDISMHNRIADSMRRILSLDRKLNEMQGDVSAMSAHLTSLRQAEEAAVAERRDRRFYWVGLISGASLAGLTAHTVFKEVLELWIAKDASAPAPGQTVADPDLVLARWLALGLGFACFAISWHLASWSNPPGAAKPKDKRLRSLRTLMARRSLR